MTEDQPDADPTVGPYAATAFQYHQAGWPPLPLPYGQKKSPPNGWTGRDGSWPSGADIQAWIEDRPSSNIALRMPPSVLGIDVDDYNNKPGAAVLDALEKQHGPLPPTWTSSSRGGRSGIRFYRVPEGLRWPGVLGPGIETIRFDHRYAVAWPSVHPEGGTYRWTRPDSAIALDEVPHVDELPPLPPAWVEALTGGLLSTDQPRADLRRTEIDSWLYRYDLHNPLCRVMQNVLDRGTAELGSGTSRHDAALALTNRIAWLMGEGHTGGSQALARAKLRFIDVTQDRHEDGEWDRMVDGAVRLSAAAHPDKQPDPCADPFAGLIPTGANLWKKTPTSPTAASSTTTTETQPVTTATPPGLNPALEDPSSAATADITSLPTDAPDALEIERSSWWPRNTETALDPDNAEPGPAFLARDDNHCLFYPGRVNGILAPSESGKTWIALLAVVQAVHDGHRATILDFEDTHRGVTERLLALGLTPDQIREHVAYIGPDEPITSPLFPAGRDLYEHLHTWQPTIIILDGVNAAMTMHNLDLISNKDATTFAQQLLQPLTSTGACVIYVDHTPKDNNNNSAGGIGAQAKRAMTTGCAIRVNVNKQFGKGQNGTLTLMVDKDRQGDVRGASKPSGEAGHWAGTAQLTSHNDSTVTIVIESPDTRIEHRKDAPTWRPTIYMERVSRYIEANPGQGRNIITGSCQGDEKRIKDALRRLVDDGWVRIEADGQKHRHYTVTPFSELTEPPNPTGGGTGGGPGVPPPVKNRGWVGVTEQDEVLRHTPPGSGPPPSAGVNGNSTPSSYNLVKRVLDGVNEVWVDLASGVVYPLDQPPAGLR